MPTSLPRLSEDLIKRYVPDPSFGRGRSYYRNGAIFDTVRRGNQIEGFCAGSTPEPYQVKVTLTKNGIAGNECSCPVGGSCKHVVALLLTWVHAPDRFEARDSVDAMLERKSKYELTALIKEMLKRSPELERLIDLPVPGKGGQRQAPVKADTYRRQIRHALHDTHDWHGAADAAQEVGSVVDIGDGFAEQDDWENAQIAYQAVIDEVLPHYLETGDEGDIGGEVSRAVEGLVACLEAGAEDAPARRASLRSLFDVLKWDIDAGGLGISDAAPDALRQHATAEDRREIRQWIREAIKTTGSDSWSQNYHRQTWGRLLDSFTEPEDVEAFLKEARQQGLHRPLFEKLLELRRFAEALDVAEKHLTASGWERLQAAETIFKAGRADDALAFAKAGLPNKDTRLADWVAQQYIKRGQWAAALDAQMTAWQDRPTLEHYKTLATAAKKLKQWEEVRPRLLADLEKRQNFQLLVQIHLHEKEWDAAWDSAEHDRSPWSHLRLEVARAAEKHRPERAIPVYLDQAEGLIRQQGRSNYASAAQYLVRARNLLRQIERSADWPPIIAALRERHKKLPALQEELTKAKL